MATIRNGQEDCRIELEERL